MLTKSELRHIDHPQWDVMVIVQDNADYMNDELVRLGKLGWEPIACAPITDRYGEVQQWHATVKRRLDPAVEGTP